MVRHDEATAGAGVDPVSGPFGGLPAARAKRIRWPAGHDGPARIVPEEVPVAFTFNGSSHAVMMASPSDLEDFAVGFALSEGLVEARAEILDIEIIETEIGVSGRGFEARMWIGDEPAAALSARRRRIAGPTGCGLCGIESLEEAVRPVASVGGTVLDVAPEDIAAAAATLAPAQRLGALTRAVHAAGFVVPGRGLVALREDVGRHNALDKLGGALARAGEHGRSGMVVVTSRVSIEMVQKTAAIGAPILVAVSAPTSLAIAAAEAAGLTLVAVARADGFEVFTHARRIAGLAGDYGADDGSTRERETGDAG